MDMNLYSISEKMDVSEINEVLKSAAEVLDRATQRMVAGEEGSQLNADFPLIVKNTFFDLAEPMPELECPKSQSCPIAAFNCLGVASSSLGSMLAGEKDLMPYDLAAAARLFSSGEVSRAELEKTGHVAPRCPRPPPPAPLNEPLLFDSSMPLPPTWSPKFGSTMPPAPTWSPKVNAPVVVPQAPSFQPDFKATPAPACSWYRVAYAHGVQIRSGPSVNAPHIGAILAKNEFFAVSEEVCSNDGRIYLRLADGRGWAFDDSALMPYDPTVVKGRWVPAGPEPSIADHSPSVALHSNEVPWEPMEEPQVQDVQEDIDDVSQETPKRRRRKRGGVKRNKAKRRLAEALAQQMKEDSEEVDTDVPSEEGGGMPSSSEEA